MSELADFVLSYYQVNGALVESPGYGVYEALLPEALAAPLGAPVFQQIVFDPPEAASDGRLHLTVGHPLVDRMVDLARQSPAPAQIYINTVRLDKHGLAALARQALAFPNARLVEAPRQTEARALCHYVHFIFKVTLTTDEKHEHLVSVAMDAQSGWPVDFAPIQAQVTLDEKPEFANLSPALPIWIKVEQPLAPNVLTGLLERAQRAVLGQASDSLDGLRRRTARYLELDRARLEQYYDDIARDLERRLQRTEEERRPALQDKLASVQAERQLKLADAEARYKLRVDLELVTAEVIVQPKQMLVVQIENRTAQVQRRIVWDPLLHRIEPLRCDVCGQPGASLHLCTGGHLAHAECLIERQCVDCKRVYCRLCQKQMNVCVVCGRVVCASSLNKCGECGRGTCREHSGLCHANNGEPAKLIQPASGLPPIEATSVVKPAEEPPRPTSDKKHPPKEQARPRMSAALRRAREREKISPKTSPLKLLVQIEPREPVVTAFVMTAKERDVAIRSWILSPTGIRVECECEKGAACSANNLLLKPQSAQAIEAQLEAEISKFCQEYHVSPQRVTYLALVRGNSAPMLRLILSGAWKDKLALSQSLAGWQVEYDRQFPRYTPPRPTWSADLDKLTPEENAQAERVVKIAGGLLAFEGVLKADELFERVTQLARPGAWCDRHHFESLLRKHSRRFKVLMSGWVATPDVRNVTAMAKRKANYARSAPPREVSIEELLAASEELPLSEQEKRLEAEFWSASGFPMSIRPLQRMARNADSIPELVSEAAEFLRISDEHTLEKMRPVLTDLWNCTPRYELRGRAPSEVEEQT